MAKRFTDTDKWKKPFIRSMKAPYKLLWLYILDECDHAGIWQVDIEVAQIKIGEKIKVEEATKAFQGRISIFDNGNKWFIPDFIEFQYGSLNPENRAHGSAIQKLLKYSLIDGAYKPLGSPLEGDKDKDKDKEEDKDKGVPTEEELRKKLDGKAKKFGETITPFKQTYPIEMLKKFFEYWTEPNKPLTKLRWELEETWDIARRLKRWADNNSNVIGQKNNSESRIEITPRRTANFEDHG